MKKIVFLSLYFLLSSMDSKGQDCAFFPADCPDNGSIKASQSESIRLSNGLLPQEIQMQDRMRNLVSDMIYTAAKSLHWRVVEMDDVSNLDPLQSSSTPFSLRSPRGYGIEFQFIVNKDSLEAWKNWLIDISNRYTNAGSDYMDQQKDIYNSPLYKQYNDSVNRYIKLSTDYMTAHQSEGAKLFEDKKLLSLQNKQNDFTNKISALVNDNQYSKDGFKNLDEEKVSHTMRFRNAALLQIFFEFNSGVGIINSEDGGVDVSDYNVAGALIAKSVHLLHPDINTIPWHFDQWENMTVLLMGNWLAKHDQNRNYTAGFDMNGQADELTPKKIKSDQVQTIAIHIMGSKKNTNLIMPFINTGELNKVIVKNY